MKINYEIDNSNPSQTGKGSWLICREDHEDGSFTNTVLYEDNSMVIIDVPVVELDNYGLLPL